jgi:hypothetical protein
MTSLSLSIHLYYSIYNSPILIPLLPLLVRLLPSPISFLSLSLSLSLSPAIHFSQLPLLNTIQDPRLTRKIIMIRDFLQRRKECDGGKGKNLVMMEQPELSLAPSFATNFNYGIGDNNLKLKGKQLQMYYGSETTNEDLELQLCDPLPLDWEQCLDLKVISLYLSLCYTQHTHTRVCTLQFMCVLIYQLAC